MIFGPIIGGGPFSLKINSDKIRTPKWPQKMEKTIGSQISSAHAQKKRQRPKISGFFPSILEAALGEDRRDFRSVKNE